MKCNEYQTPLGDYVDGTLPAADVSTLEAHLAACAKCRATVADFAAIRSMARSLEPHVPAPHVWQKLSSSTSGRRGRWSFLSVPLVGWQPAAAAAMAMALTAGLWWIGDRPSTIDSATTAFAVAESEPSYVVVVDVAELAAEAHYTTAIARLEQVTTAERDTLDPETADVLAVGLTIIDDAIVESRAALETEPGSGVAQESLFQALRSKVALLQDMLALINEMRRGNQNGAARIISELNP
jgi:hypothetical protein